MSWYLASRSRYCVGEGGREAADVLVEREEAGGEAQFVHGAEMLFGSAEGADDPAQGEGLERGGCAWRQGPRLV